MIELLGLGVILGLLIILLTFIRDRTSYSKEIRYVIIGLCILTGSINYITGCYLAATIWLFTTIMWCFVIKE